MSLLLGILCASVANAAEWSPTGQPAAPQAFCEPIQCWTLTIGIGGNGSGSWKSTDSTGQPDGLIDCEQANGAITVGNCSELYGDYDDIGYVRVYMTVTPATGSSVCDNGVVGTCSSSPVSFQTDLQSDLTLSYLVFVLSTHTLLVDIPEHGTISNSGLSINCDEGLADPDCEETYNYGTQVTLTATPWQGVVFKGWTDACAAIKTVTCTLTMTGDRIVGATFADAPTAPPPTAPTATTPPAATPRPTSVRTPGPTPPSASSQASSGAASPSLGEGASAGVSLPIGSSNASMDVAAASAGAGATPGRSPDPSAAAAVGTVDLTPVVFAILGAGLLIAAGIAIAGYEIRRRGRKPGGSGEGDASPD